MDVEELIRTYLRCSPSTATPDHEERAIELVLQQAELFAASAAP